MGMYTEIVAGFRLKENTPKSVIAALYVMIDGVSPIAAEMPDHPLFSKPRWKMLGTCSSFYFGFSDAHSVIKHDSNGNGWIVSIRADLKNYDDEIEAFFAWIKPYVAGGSGENNMIGYSIYESSSEPTIYYAGWDCGDD